MSLFDHWQLIHKVELFKSNVLGIRRFQFLTIARRAKNKLDVLVQSRKQVRYLLQLEKDANMLQGISAYPMEGRR